VSYRDFIRLRPCWGRGDEVPWKDDYFFGLRHDTHFSRERHSLLSDPTAHPAIDPNYYATDADLAIRNETRKILGWMLSTSVGQSIIEGGLTDHAGDMDKAIDARFYHPGGTCAMGKVVDGACRVMGMNGLRVVDASIIPLPIGVHQATVYRWRRRLRIAFSVCKFTVNIN